MKHRTHILALATSAVILLVWPRWVTAKDEAPETLEACITFIEQLGRESELARAAGPSIIAKIDAFHEHARALASRALDGNFGASYGANAFERQRLVRSLEARACQFGTQPAVQYCTTRLVDAHLASVFYGAYGSEDFQKRLEGEVQSQGIVFLGVTPRGTQQELSQFLDSRPELNQLPRLALGNEDNPVTSDLQSRLTRVKFEYSTYEQLPRPNPLSKVYDLHLFGLLSLDALSEELERYMGLLAVQHRAVDVLQIHIYPQYHFIEGLAPKFSLSARLAKSESYLANFSRGIVEEIDLTSEVAITQQSNRTILSARHRSSIEIRIVLEPMP